ncbi:MAG TPA: adenylate/guanylate cyclase domain-containing protein [Abditibacteriaceae bacterium]|nr:adenylate/guanylate cyclase domain-containing protein [Abditibacteriaceae bacterium]
MLPTGTITLLFSDIEGSTKLLHDLDESYPEVLERHRSLLRTAVAAWHGHEVKVHGDSFFFVFQRAADSVAAAVAAQRALAAEQWPLSSPVRVRMGLHTGEPSLTANDYIGVDVHRGARLMAAGHGGQVLLSETVQMLVANHLPAGVSLRDWGEHHLKDLPQPERIYQLVIEGLVNDFPPLETSGKRPHNLPAQLTALIGREGEVEAACALLRRPGLRLLTLTGTGGTGKTRLSLEIAARLLADFEDGVFFVELAAIDNADLLLSTIAPTLGVREGAGQTLRASLQSYLSGRRLLLVLDNFEQVIEAAPVVTQLMAACAHLKVLVTSRKALHLRGEQEFPVSPLALPNLHDLPGVKALSHCAAVQLFIERAVAVKPDFALTNDNAPAVAEICARLDGLPLAIELAASRTRLLSPHAMLARLSSRLKFLTGGARDLPARHQTLEAAIYWSYDLLNDREQMLLRRLAVFVGGCTVAAAEAVLGDDAGDVLDGLASLVDESLLRQQDIAGEPRFWMLETIREFAWARLEESGEKDAMQRRHAVYYSTLSHELEGKLRGFRQLEYRRRMLSDRENIRAALNWALEHEPHLAIDLAVITVRYSATLGEARDFLEQTLARTEDGCPLARLYLALGMVDMTVAQGDFATARAYVEAAQRLLEDAKAKLLLSDEQYQVRLANTERWLATVAMNQGDFVTARALAQEHYTVVGGEDSLSGGVTLAILDLSQGNYEAARAFFEKYIAQYRSTLSHSKLSLYLLCLGNALRYQGHYEEAAAVIGQSSSLQKELGRKSEWLLQSRGWIARHRQDYELAATLFKASLVRARDGGEKRSVINSLAAMAGMAAVQGRAVRAVRLGGAVASILESCGMVLYAGDRADLEHDLAAARAMLDETTLAAAWAAGRAMTVSQAVEYALGSEDEPGDQSLNK